MDSKVSQFVTDASEAESMVKSLSLPSVSHLLPHLVDSAQSLARPSISNFHVGAVGLGSDGRVFFGVNLEFPGLPLHHSVHAEQFLLTNLAVHRCSRLLSFAVSAAPCGHCRQFLQELRLSSSVEIHITADSGDCKDAIFKPLSEILPNPFGPHDLLDQETPLLLESHHNRLDLPMLNDASNTRNLCNGNSNVEKLSNGNCEKHDFDEARLRESALEAANSAHAPYSGCPSGVALMDCEGKVYRGSYIESAAYNPSLGPVQAALVTYVAGGGGGYERIVAAVLVEKEVAKVKQEDTARMIFKAISPKCEFKGYLGKFLQRSCVAANALPCEFVVEQPQRGSADRSAPKNYVDGGGLNTFEETKLAFLKRLHLVFQPFSHLNGADCPHVSPLDLVLCKPR